MGPGLRPPVSISGSCSRFDLPITLVGQCNRQVQVPRPHLIIGRLTSGLEFGFVAGFIRFQLISGPDPAGQRCREVGQRVLAARPNQLSADRCVSMGRRRGKASQLPPRQRWGGCGNLFCRRTGLQLCHRNLDVLLAGKTKLGQTLPQRGWLDEGSGVEAGHPQRSVTIVTACLQIPAGVGRE